MTQVVELGGVQLLLLGRWCRDLKAMQETVSGSNYQFLGDVAKTTTLRGFRGKLRISLSSSSGYQETWGFDKRCVLWKGVHNKPNILIGNNPVQGAWSPERTKRLKR